ncbi:MAG TPA: discoidin domain-containing protein, partial [Gemmataceae bacterium]|nr:discoidin domain-containing protein [Gemmataceae bacterium]
LTAELPPRKPAGDVRKTTPVNFAVNNDGHYFPRITASYSNPRTPVSKVIDGNYWYHASPPNRWTCEGSPNTSDWLAVDFGVKRPIHTLKLYLLDDGDKVAPPARIDLEYWTGKAWAAVPKQERTPKEPTGRRANVIRFPALETRKLRAVLTHRDNSRAGLTEFEAWGDADLPVAPAPPPAGNLAFNPGGKLFPRASASYTSRFDKVQMANDGVVSFNPSPHNRWTSYESPNAADWLEIDFGGEKQVGRVELAIYDDRGGVQAPASYSVQYWDGKSWHDAAEQKRSPEQPTGGQVNEVRFRKVRTARVRVVFTHKGKARTGVSEVFIWPE